MVLYDPQAAATCAASGVRSTVNLFVGGKTDSLHGQPVPIQGRVRTISDGLFVETAVRHGGWGKLDQGLTAVVSLGIHPERKKMPIVKGVVAPRAAYDPIEHHTILVDTPGVISANPAYFQYSHGSRALFPIAQDVEYPNRDAS